MANTQHCPHTTILSIGDLGTRKADYWCRDCRTILNGQQVVSALLEEIDRLRDEVVRLKGERKG